jgi:sialic acid synthase SpsE
MEKIKFIAEVSSNHNRDLGRMKEFISTSAEIGCSGVKFQLFKIDQLFAPEILKKSEKHRARQEWELPEETIPKLAEYAHTLDLEFSCTPFYLEAVDIIDPYVDFYKIASYELLWLKLFEKCSKTGKPIVFSTGMANFNEIERALKEISKGKTEDVTILHCNSAYPTPVEDANLRVIKTLKSELSSWRDKLNIKIGWSDHTVSESVIYRVAHKYNIDFIEFHLDLDGTGEEYQAGHCWLPNQISTVINNINTGLKADGSGKIAPSPSEMSDRIWRADPSDGLRPLLQTRAGY